jgi:hypothetical protein
VNLDFADRLADLNADRAVRIDSGDGGYGGAWLWTLSCGDSPATSGVKSWRDTSAWAG